MPGQTDLLGRGRLPSSARGSGDGLGRHGPARFGGRLGPDALAHGGQLLFDRQIALSDLLLQVAVGLQRLLDHKERFGPVIARQCCFNLLRALLDAPVRQAGQRSGVAFSGQDGIQDRQAALAGEVARARGASAGSSP
jgi:hypothetical protein